MKSVNPLLLVLLGLFLTLEAHAATTNWLDPETPIEKRALTFEQLGAATPLALWGSQGSNEIAFGIRSDEFVSGARLRLTYSWSPALLPHLSHLRVLLNEHIVTTLPLPKEQAGAPITTEITLDPSLIGDHNRLRFQLMGYYTERCQDPVSPLLWLNISNLSELELDVSPLEQVADLARFPEPFFEERDNQRLVLPFVLAAGSDADSLAASAILASWFGAQAAWRGADFPVADDINQVTERYSIVLATNEHRPDFLADREAVSGPVISIVPHPRNRFGRILLLQGRTGADLRTAATALVTGQALLSGQQVRIDKVATLLPRRPYDAPRWVPLDRPVKLGELAPSRALQVKGHQPGSIRVDLRIPPDLFVWNSKGVPLDLKYRYSPPIDTDESRLNIFVNDGFVETFNLFDSGHGGIKQRVRIPVPGATLFGGNALLIPPYELSMRNQLRFDFSFAYHKKGECEDTVLDNTVAAIDEDSRIDFSGFSHYAALPDLNYFAGSGYPFTRLADLSETRIVMSATPSATEIRLLLVLMGVLGDHTGYPVTGVQIQLDDDSQALRDKDLIVIGSAAAKGLFGRWQITPHDEVFPQGALLSSPRRQTHRPFDWPGFDGRPDTRIANQVQAAPQGPLAAVVGFESPVSDRRSVVALLGNSPAALQTLTETLLDPAKRMRLEGSASFLRGARLENVDGVLVGDTYYVGNIPAWKLAWFYLSQHPLVLALMVLLAIVILGIAIWLWLRGRAAGRLNPDEGDAA